MVSLVVETAAPEDTLPLPRLPSALMAALRAELLLAAAAAVRRRDVDIGERGRVLRVARVDLHHDVILIDRAVDDGDLALAEGVVERVVDLRRRDAQA